MTIMHAAIYARFSTDLQNERSVEDQIALCRSYAAAERMAVTKVYSDHAKSGASIFGRDGLLSLLADVKSKIFDAVIVEHTDRLSRDMEDLSGIYKRFNHVDVTLRAVHSGGAMNTALIGLFGLVGQMQREDGAKKVKRGMAGVIRDGRHAGGRAYGYRPVAGQPGALAIVADEAAVAARIIRAYADGEAPRAIAKVLNDEGVPPPRGARWTASTINGDAKRGSGILHNRLYVGELVWNRVRMVKHPDTGRRLSRLNDASAHQVVLVPQLAIVDRATWDRAQARKTARSQISSGERKRTPNLLSGLLRCAACGGGLSIHDRDKHGRVRIRCSTVRESGSCRATRRLPLARIEKAVLEGLREHLDDTSLIETFVRTYNAERQRLAARAGADRARIETRLARAQAELDRAVRNLIKGTLDEAEADVVLPQLRAARDRLREELAGVEETPKVLALHPAAITNYLKTVDILAALIGSSISEGIDSTKLFATLRDLVDHVVVDAPVDSKNINIEIKGKLARLVGGNVYPDGLGFVAVAEEGLEPPTRGL